MAHLALHHHQRVVLQQRLVAGEGVGEQRGFDAPGAVVQGDEAHLVALLVLHHPQVDDQPGDGLQLARRLEVDDALAGETPYFLLVLVDRVTGEVQAQGFLLAAQALLDGELAHLAVVGVHVGFRLGEYPAEQVHVAALLTARGLLGGLHGLFHGGQQHRAVEVHAGLVGLEFIVIVRTKAIQRTGADQRLQGALVDALEVDAIAEVEQVLERSAFGAAFDDGFHRPLADALDGTQAVDDAPVVVDGELELRGVHVRRVEAQLHVAAFLDEDHHLVGVVHVRRQHRGHERRRVMGLQPAGLVGHQAVGGRVRLVEAVAGELFHQVEDVARQLAIDAVVGAALDEAAALLGHFLGLLLAHGAAQHVGAAEGVAGHHLGDLHHLFLVQDDAVGGLEHRLEARVLVVRVRVGERRAAVLAVDEVVHHARLQRAGAEQRHEGDHVFQAVGLELLDQLLHAARFELEHGRGLGLLQHVVGFLVIQRDAVDIDQLGLAATALLAMDGFQRPLDDGQRAQAEEVELHQAGLLHVVLVELGHQAVAFLVAQYRREIGQLGRRDHHAAGVLAGTAGDAFELEGHVPDFLGFLVVLEELAQRLLHLEGLLQGHAHFEGDHLRQLVGQAVGLALGARHVAHHRLGGHGAEGDDLAHRVAAVLVGHVVDHPVAAVHAEVDVEVGHGDAFGVQEAFEQQVIGQRVEVGDLQHIGDQRAGARAPPRPHRHAVVLGPLDEVHHDQEVAGEAHLDDGVELELQAIDVALAHFLVVGRGCLRPEHRQTLFQPLVGGVAQVLVDVHAVGGREIRQEVLAQLHFDVAAPGDFHRVLDGVRQVAEQLGHLLGRLQVLLVAVLARTARIIQGAAFADAHAGLVGGEIVLLEEAHVVGGHDRRTAAIGQRYGGVQVFLVVDPVGALQLDVETLREDRQPFAQQALGQRLVAIQQRLADLPFLGAGQGDQSFGRLLDPLALDHHQTVALALGPAPRHQLGQVQVALGVHHQQGHAAQRAIFFRAGQPDIRTADRLDARAIGRLVELHQRMHVVDFGDRHRRHPGRRHGLDQRLDAHQAIDQRELGVQTQMDERNGHG